MSLRSLVVDSISLGADSKHVDVGGPIVRGAKLVHDPKPWAAGARFWTLKVMPVRLVLFVEIEFAAILKLAARTPIEASTALEVSF